MIIILEKLDKRGNIYQWSSQLDGLVVTTEYGPKGSKMRKQIKNFTTTTDAVTWWTSKFWEKLIPNDYKVLECTLTELYGFVDNP
jgi:hypothetical protein